MCSRNGTNSKDMSNVHYNWEHIDTFPYVPTNVGHIEVDTPNLITNLDTALSITQSSADNYIYNGIPFKVKDHILTINDLTLPLPQRTNISTIEQLFLNSGFRISNNDISITTIDLSTVSFKEILQALTCISLKNLHIVSSTFNQNKRIKYGKVIFDIYLKVETGSGNIQAKDKDLRWLNEVDTLKLKSKLFDETSYQVGVNSKQYTSTSYAELIFSNVFSLLQTLEFDNTHISMQPLDFTISHGLLNNIKIRDMMLLMNNCIGYNNNCFIIRPTVKDIHYGRVYSVFTSISSDTRSQLGFINYDIGSALQSICLQKVQDDSLYPLHKELMNDKVAFRNKVMIETSKDMDWVKEELSKINNLDKMPKNYEKYPTLKVYYAEAIPLRNEILANADPILLSRATIFAKSKWIKIVAAKDKVEFVEDGKKESSIFFFIWTQWERQIREIMMNCFSNPSACHQVHDAVYSTQDINASVIESRVLVETGFNVKISKN